MINNKASSQSIKIKSDVGTVFAPTEGNSYSHHASIAYFKGRFYAVWSNGRKNEDDCGQRVMIASSADGLNWENIRPLATPEMLGDKNAVLTSGGLFANGNTLIAYIGYFRYDEQYFSAHDTRPFEDAHHLDTTLFAMTTTDGISFCEPVKIGLNLIPNHGIFKTASGRLIMVGNILYPYTDTGDGITDFTLSGIYGDAFEGKTPVDDSESINYVTKHNGWNVPLVCEGSIFQDDGGQLHLMLRTNSEYLWHANSADGGQSWSEPAPTEFTNGASKHHFARLPDGRYYAVSNPVPHSYRIPLSIHISKDGENFDCEYILRDEECNIKFDGFAKGGIYAYPHSIVQGGYLYIIYSKNKEEIEVSRVAIENL